MPSLGFVLPDWLYWSGLVLFPLAALLLVRREARHGLPGNASFPIAYMLWLCGGFVGLHRFYLRSWLGFVYLPLLVAILFGNIQASEMRVSMSTARDDITKAEFLLERAIDRQGEESAQAQQYREQAAKAREQLEETAAEQERIDSVIVTIAIVIAILLAIDFFLIPGLIRKYRANHGERAPPPTGTGREEVKPAPPRPEGLPGRIVWYIDRISGWTGHFIAMWSVLAVFVYYYEVIARYVFNSPTNWAHESMFLMFGMMYLLSGAFALREGSHVRVDVLYQYLPLRARAILDIVTSISFFIFVIAMLWTGWTFAADSIAVWEVSFTEWAIQYWPVKLAIPVGAALILLQGIAELIRSLAVLTGWDVPGVTAGYPVSHGAS